MASGSNGTDVPGRGAPAAEIANGIRRRELLVAGGAVAGAALITRFESGTALFDQLLRGSGEGPSFTARMLRPEDMLAFDLEFYDASYEVNGEGQPFAFPTPTDGTQREDF